MKKKIEYIAPTIETVDIEAEGIMALSAGAQENPGITDTPSGAKRHFWSSDEEE